jgi:hypothetical protein
MLVTQMEDIELCPERVPALEHIMQDLNMGLLKNHYRAVGWWRGGRMNTLYREYTGIIKQVE